MSRGLNPLLMLGWLASLQQKQGHMRGRPEVLIAVQAGIILWMHVPFHLLMHQGCLQACLGRRRSDTLAKRSNHLSERSSALKQTGRTTGDDILASRNPRHPCCACPSETGPRLMAPSKAPPLCDLCSELCRAGWAPLLPVSLHIDASARFGFDTWQQYKHMCRNMLSACWLGFCKTLRPCPVFE